MLKALGFGKGSTDSTSTKKSSSRIVADLLDNATDLEHAFRSMDLLMDDRMDESYALLKDKKSAFCKLARGVITFIEATLGFEPEAIKKATNTLQDCEQAAYKEHQQALHSGFSSSSLFPPGIEYSVVYAEAQLLGAVTLFLSESVIDSAKALYKLRKAYQTLEEVNKQVSISNSHPSLTTYQSIQTSVSHKSFTLGRWKSRSSVSGRSEKEYKDGLLTPETLKNSEVAAKAKKYYQARLERLKILTNEDLEFQISQAAQDSMSLNHYHKLAGQDTVDEYITSAINACYGILQLIISVIPPGIGRLLSVVGFHGNEVNGLTMLWRATNQMNIHGAIALLALQQFYDGPTQTSDFEAPKTSDFSPESSSELSYSNDQEIIIPDLNDIKDVKRKLKLALHNASKLYSRGALWQLQEGRTKATEGDIRGAVEIMNDTSRGPINLRQVEGLMLFDKSMLMILLHDYQRCSTNFLKLIELSSWSHMLYTYLSAMCKVEIYRAHKVDNSEKAQIAKEEAGKLLEMAPSHLAKKKILSKPMPFDKFVLRKINQWKEVAAASRIHIVDAIGTSPIHEIVYFWNGYRHMPRDDLELALKLLGYTGQGDLYSYSTNESILVDETEDERLTRCLLQSVVLRYLGRVEEGYELLKTRVIPKIYHDTPSKGHFKSGLPKVTFIKKHSDAWVGPSAIYEMAVFVWIRSGPEKIGLVRDYLELANSWGDDYELSTRIGLKIKSTLSRLNRLYIEE